MSSGAFGWTFGGETVEDMGDFNRSDEGAALAARGVRAAVYDHCLQFFT